MDDIFRAAWLPVLVQLFSLFTLVMELLNKKIHVLYINCKVIHKYPFVRHLRCRLQEFEILQTWQKEKLTHRQPLKMK